MNGVEQTMLRVAKETVNSFAMPRSAKTGLPGAPSAVQEFAAVEFSGPFRGRLLAAVSLEMLEPLAVHMLGLGPAHRPSAEQQREALRRLAGAICESLVRQLATRGDVFHIQEPRPATAGEMAEPPRMLTHAGTVELDLDVGRLCLAFHTTQPDM
jgi:hypothetical protein